MATTWPAIRERDDERLGDYVVPGSTRMIRLRRGPTAALLLALASEYNREIARIDAGPVDDWGWARTNAHASATGVGHITGTAIDLNAAPVRRRGVFRRMSDFLTRYVKAQRLKRKYKVVVWGGASINGEPYRTPRHWTWTHWAIRPDATEAQVAEVVAELGIRPDGTFGTRPPVVPTRRHRHEVQVKLANIQPGSTNRDVKLYQTALRLYLTHHGIKPDLYNPDGATGFYGAQTKRMTAVAYGVAARVTGEGKWLDGDLSRPGDSLLARLGLNDRDR